MGMRIMRWSFCLSVLIWTCGVQAELIGHWPLDEADGTTAADISGREHHGTYEDSPGLGVPGVFGTAMDASGGYMTADLGDDLPTGAAERSITLWLSTPAVQSDRKFCGYGSETAGQAFTFCIENVDAQDGVRMRHWGGNMFYPGFITGEWNHIAIRVPPDATIVNDTEVFINGEYIAGYRSGGSDQQLATTDSVFSVGTSIGAQVGQVFDGLIDDVQFFDHAIDEAEVMTIMLGETPVQAYGPTPAEGTMIEQTSILLKWRAGDFAAAHEVYLGADPEAVAAATPDDADLFLGRVGTELLAVGLPGSPRPEALAPGQTYYWRVDEVNDVNPEGPWTGDVWSFWVQPATAYQPYPIDTMRNVDPNQDLSWDAGLGTLFHTIYFGESFEEVDAAVAGGYMSVENVYDPGTLDLNQTYYWRVDEFKGATTDRGQVWSFTTRGEGGGVEAEYFAGMELAGDPIETRIESNINLNASGEVVGGLEDQVSARWRANLEAPLTEPVTLITTSDDGVRLYVDGRLVIDNWTNHGSTDDTATIDMIAGQVHMIVMEWYEDGGGAVAQLSWQSDTMPRQIIPQGWLQLPLKATSPSPVNGDPHAVQDPILSWNGGDNATGHDVYFGDDVDAVAGADTTTAGVYRGQQAADVTTYNPGPLEWGKTYYWRVDEVTADGVLTGALWSFTTADFVIVDDFERYNNEVGSRPFEVWIDGFGFTLPEPGNAGNGTNAAVGYDIWSPDSPHYNGLLMETDVVHSGYQSMPVDYNNVIAPYSSEIERTWATPQDWTVNGVDTLAMHVRGTPVNDEASLYVMLADSTGSSAVVTYADAGPLRTNAWSAIAIPLADFAGVNPAAVTKMVVGFGDRDAPAPGGAGSVLFDDFRVTSSQ
jgi:hypothetical protein